MSEEKMSCFYELINGFEIVGTLTDDGRKLVKDGVLHLQQENKQLKEELQKADSITHSCIFEGKEESTINFRECLNKLKLYKEVIEEVREYIDNNTEFEHDGDDYGYTEWVNIKPQNIVFINELLEILDKSKENK